MLSSGLIRTAFASALLLVAAAAPTQAQVSGTITLHAGMPSLCSVQVTQTNTASIDLVRGVNNLTVGRVGEQCNHDSGFTVTISSANAGALVTDDGQRVPYTVRYDNSGTVSLAQPVVLTRTRAQRTLSTKNFRVTVPAAPQAIAGSYADTIIVAIAAR